jgi:hypothetical protein
MLEIIARSSDSSAEQLNNAMLLSVEAFGTLETAATSSDLVAEQLEDATISSVGALEHLNQPLNQVIPSQNNFEKRLYQVIPRQYHL